MSPSITSPDVLRPALTAAAAALARSLAPAGDLLPGPPYDGLAPRSHLLPGPDALAVAAPMTGAIPGTIVAVVSPELAATLSTPSHPAGLAALLTEAVAELGQAVGGPLQLQAVQPVEAMSVLGELSDGRQLEAIPLLRIGRHQATLAVLVDPARFEAAELAPAAASSVGFEPLVAAPGPRRSLEVLGDVEMGVTAELGRTRMTLQDLMALVPGSIIELDRAAGSPVDVLVNGTLIARGEVVVIDEEFGVRISEVVGQDGDGKRAGR